MKTGALFEQFYPEEPFFKRKKIKMLSKHYCPICGLQQTHHRLFGYRCSNPEHQELENEIFKKFIDSEAVVTHCPHCKESVIPGMSYCESCGERVLDDNT